jgi:hypothetical protein
MQEVQLYAVIEQILHGEIHTWHILLESEYAPTWHSITHVLFEGSYLYGFLHELQLVLEFVH